jgi:hypothetical protein
MLRYSLNRNRSTGLEAALRPAGMEDETHLPVQNPLIGDSEGLVISVNGYAESNPCLLRLLFPPEKRNTPAGEPTSARENFVRAPFGDCTARAPERHGGMRCRADVAPRGGDKRFRMLVP